MTNNQYFLKITLKQGAPLFQGTNTYKFTSILSSMRSVHQAVASFLSVLSTVHACLTYTMPFIPWHIQMCTQPQGNSEDTFRCYFITANSLHTECHKPSLL